MLILSKISVNKVVVVPLVLGKLLRLDSRHQAGRADLLHYDGGGGSKSRKSPVAPQTAHSTHSVHQLCGFRAAGSLVVWGRPLLCV